MTNGGFQRLSAEREGMAAWPALPHGDAAPWPETAREALYIWLIGRDGTVAATLHESGRWRQVALPLPAIAGALATTGAPCLFMAHSHPSGDPRPSHADIEATRQIWRLARMLGASLQDHFVIGRRRIFSFRASGLL